MAGLRVATWNCQHGRPVPSRVGESVAELDVDVLGIQEVDRGSRRVDRRDLAAQAQEAFDGHLTWAPAFTFSEGGEYGHALLVRGEVQDEVAAIVEVVVDGQRWTVANTHLSNHRLMAAEQLATLLDVMRSWPVPRVLLGDLNLEVPHVLPSLTAESYRLAIGPATYPAHRPRRQIDHVAVSGRGYRVTPFDALQLPVGDHRALIADVHCSD